MAIITSPIGTAMAAGTDSARPRKGEVSPADPGFASLLAMLVSGVAPALPPAGIGNQPPSQSQQSKGDFGVQLPGSLTRPDLEQLARSMMQAALDQMGPALLDGPGGPDSAEALKLLAGMKLTSATGIEVGALALPGGSDRDMPGLDQAGVRADLHPLPFDSAEAMEEASGANPGETASPGGADPLRSPRRPQLVLLPHPATVVERVVLGERPTGTDPTEPPGRIDPAAVPDAGPVPAAAESSGFSDQEHDLADSAAPPELEPARHETPPDPASEWVSAGPANQAVHAGPPPAEAAARAAAEPLPALRHLAAEPVAPERLMAALREVAAGTEPGTYEITLRLSPESLGEVKVTLQLTGSEVRTVMEVAGADARQALESGADRLRQGLSQAGLTLSGFHVNTGLGGQQGRTPASEWPEWLRPPARRRSGTSSPISAPAATSGSSPFTRTAGGRLDTLA